ncbi:MAG TPA: hypothetical protein VFZ66_09510 [Herpetosiphonaceae bacterium]
MLYPEPNTTVYEQHSGVTGSPMRPHEAHWRFLGEREAADAAYCLRFGVVQAPEPSGMPDGVWSYAIPGVQPNP